MAEINEKWAIAIQELFANHNLSLRGAEERGGHTVTRSYLSEWMQGKVPQYKTAAAFLEHFPKEEASKCLMAADYPIPESWMSPERIEVTKEFLLTSLCAAARKLPKEDLAEVREEFDKILGVKKDEK